MIRYVIPLIILVTVSGSAIACSTCMVGDPTLSLMGMEKPFSDRLRLSVDYLSRSEELGREDFNLKTIDEQRLSLNLAYAPTARLMLGINLPYVEKQLDSYNLADQKASAPGDVTLMVKSYWQEEDSFQRHMYGFLGGIKLGTASEVKDSQGVPLDFDVQPGQGANVVNAGLWYAHFRFPYLLYASASYHIANEGFQGFEAGDALVFNATAQYALNTRFAWYLGVEGRSSDSDRYSAIEDPNSGGAIAFLTPGIVYTLQPDLLLNAVFKYPAIDKLDGDHEESAILSIGVTYDFQLH